MADYFVQWSFKFPCPEGPRREALVKRLMQQREEDEGNDEPQLSGISWEFSSHNKEQIFFYSEECGALDGLITLLQKHMERFKLKNTVIVECAYTCSKPRPGDFGGAVCRFNAQKVEWQSTQEIAQQWEREGSSW